MSFKTNLGRVRGEKGVSYVPKIVPQTENGVIKKYVIEWTSSDGSEIPETLQNTEFAVPVYVPYVNEDGFVQFTLQTNSAYSFTSDTSIKGEKGDDGHIKTQVVNELPTGSDIDVDTIYAMGDNAYIWNQSITDYNNSNGWIHLEDMIKFANYYQKQETYGKYDATKLDDTTYSAQNINDKLGETATALNLIQSILDSGSINTSTPPSTEEFYTQEEIDEKFNEISNRLEKFIANGEIEETNSSVSLNFN